MKKKKKKWRKAYENYFIFILKANVLMPPINAPLCPGPRGGQPCRDFHTISSGDLLLGVPYDHVHPPVKKKTIIWKYLFKKDLLKKDLFKKIYSKRFVQTDLFKKIYLRICISKRFIKEYAFEKIYLKRFIKEYALG